MSKLFLLSLTSMAALAAIPRADADTFGVTAEKVVFGTTTAVTDATSAKSGGGVASNSRDFIEASLAKFKAVNSTGGINGRKIELEILDDQYDQRKAAENVSKLIEVQKVFGLYGVMGSKVITTILPRIDREQSMLVCPTSGSDLLREFRKTVFLCRPFDSEASEVLVGYLVDTLGLKRISVIAQDDAFGNMGTSGVQKALAKRSMKLIERISYNVKAPNPDEIMAKLVTGNPDGVVIWGDVTIGPSVLAWAKKNKLKAQFVAPSQMMNPDLLKLAGKDAEGLVMSSLYPLVDDPRSELGKSYIRDIKAFGKEPAASHGLQGYFSASVLVEALKAAKEPLTRDSLIAGFESLDKKMIEGIGIEFNAKNRRAHNQIFLVRVDNGKIVPLER